MRYKKNLLIVSALTILLGLLVTIGWILNITLLKSVIPGYASMKFNSAFCLIISGFIFYGLVEKINKNIVVILSSMLLLISLASFSQDVFNYQLGMDQLFFTDTDIPHPGRMASTTALSFFLMGLSFILISTKTIKTIGQFILHLISLISFIAIVGYLFDVPLFYKLSFLSSMAVHTAIAIFILSISVSILNPSLGLTALFAGKTMGSKMAQRLFPRMVIALLGLGFLRIETHRLNLVDVEFGIALFATSFLVVGLFLIWETAISLDKTDIKRVQAENDLKELNENLEDTIRKRTSELDESIVLLKNNERVLWRSEHLLKGIINNTSASIFVKDKAGKYLMVNKTFAANFDMTPDEIVGKTAFDL
ncbi:MAG: hypothetical protein DI539_30030, partial [Flavobacterium psychrophilum]